MKYYHFDLDLIWKSFRAMSSINPFSTPHILYFLAAVVPKLGSFAA